MLARVQNIVIAYVFMARINQIFFVFEYENLCRNFRNLFRECENTRGIRSGEDTLLFRLHQSIHRTSLPDIEKHTKVSPLQNRLM